MKKVTILALSVAVIISLTKCADSTSGNQDEKSGTHGKVISEMMNNDAYMNEVMDSMRTKHPYVIQSSLFVIMKDNNQMQGDMMDKMMDMCKKDSSMCKMMMGKTMEMCDADQSKCKMMMGSMQSHPKGMKTMQDMGMCDMKGMKMDQKK